MDNPMNDLQPVVTKFQTDIYQAINKVMADVTTLKKRPGPQGEYFADEDIVNTIRPALVKHGIVVHPGDFKEIRQQDFTKDTNQGTKRLWKTTVIGNVRFAAASDGSYIDVPSIGASIDSYDSDANKAMTFFVKNAILKTFYFATIDNTPIEQEEVTVAPEEQAIPGMGTAVKRMWSVKDKENAAKWFVECDALPEDATVHHVESLLNLSPLTQGFLKADLIEWGKFYRQAREDGDKSGPASLNATLAVRNAKQIPDTPEGDEGVPF